MSEYDETGHTRPVRLIAIIDEYKARAGNPSDASIARAIGVARQTVSSWRRRGLKELPSQDSLRELAKLTGKDFERVILHAALLDAGWTTEKPSTPGDEAAAG